MQPVVGYCQNSQQLLGGGETPLQSPGKEDGLTQSLFKKEKQPEINPDRHHNSPLHKVFNVFIGSEAQFTLDTFSFLSFFLQELSKHG